MKKFLTLIIATLLISILAIGVFAAETTVYVEKDNINAVDTLENALITLDGNGGTIVIREDVTIDTALTIPEQDADLTITSEGGSIIFTSGTLTIEKNKNDNLFVFDVPVKTAANGLMIFAGFNSVHFTNNFTVDGNIHFFGGANAETPESNTTNGYVEEKTAMNAAIITTLPYTITVDNGVFGSFAGGCYRSAATSLIGSVAAPLTVTINGGTFNCTKAFSASDAIKGGRAFSLSGMSLLADDATLTINGGTFNTPIYVHAYIGETTTSASSPSLITKSDAKYYAADGNVTVNILGGTFTEGCVEISAEQTAASYNRLHRGNFDVTVGSDATFANTVFDATQVKAYTGETAVATLTYPASASITAKRFDVVNGAVKSYDEPIRIACVGDSITQGTGAKVGSVHDYENLAYPAQLLTKAVENGKDVIISNYGCGATGVMDYSGLYYRAGLAYVLSVEETDADYVIIGLGTNDAGEVANTAGQIKHFKDEYKDLVLSYEQNPNTKTVFGTSAIYRYRFAYNAVNTIRVLQDEVLTALKAEGKKCQYVDLYALLLEPALKGTLLSSDALHPDAEGYTYYADAIYDVLYNGVYADESFEKLSDIWVDGVNGTVDGDGSKDKPFKHMSLAFSHAAEEVTIHIVGSYEDTNFKKDGGYQWYSTTTPMNVKKITFVGEGENPEWKLSSKMFYLNSDVTFDNLNMYYSHGTGGDALYIFCQYNNVTFTETFKTPGTGYAILHAGYNVHNDIITQTRYTPAESVSSDKDCTITVNGGSFLYFLGGNLHFNNTSNANKAPYGIYSGNMTINIGKNVVFRDNYAGGALVGMNYMSGTVTANLDKWNKGQPVYTFSKLTNQSERAKDYDESNNTGTFTVNLGEGLTNSIVLASDLTGDLKVDVADVLTMLRYYLGGDMAGYDARTYYDRTDFNLINVVRLLKKTVK